MTRPRHGVVINDTESVDHFTFGAFKKGLRRGYEIRISDWRVLWLNVHLQPSDARLVRHDLQPDHGPVLSGRWTPGEGFVAVEIPPRLRR